MALNIRQDLADQLQEIADREHRTVDELQDLLANYQPPVEKEPIRLPDPEIDPFEAMCGMFDDPVTDLSETVHENNGSILQETLRLRRSSEQALGCFFLIAGRIYPPVKIPISRRNNQHLT